MLFKFEQWQFIYRVALLLSKGFHTIIPIHQFSIYELSMTTTPFYWFCWLRTNILSKFTDRNALKIGS